MIRKSLSTLFLASVVLLAMPMGGAAAMQPAKAGGGCALLGAGPAAKFLGGPAGIVHETNQKGHGATVLNRGCTYSSGDELLGYTANTYTNPAIAKTIFGAMSKGTKESTENLFLQAAGNVAITGQPGFARIHRLIPGAGEAAPAKEFLYQLVVRRGATILVEEYAANDLDSMPRLYTTARTIVPRM